MHLTRTEPETNLAFGQAYVEHLLNMRGIGDNLILVLERTILHLRRYVSIWACGSHACCI